MINKNEPTIISFIGTTPNVGTTVAALRHCFHIAQFTMCRVLYLCFNLKSSKLHRYFGLTDPSISLDGLLPQLKTRQLSKDSFSKLLYQPTDKNEVYILFGNKQRELAEHYLEEDLLYLLDIARQQFDYIVIDANSYWDNAGSFVAIQSAHHIVVTTTDARSHFQEDFQRWFGTLSPHISIDIDSVYLLLIRQTFSDQHYSYKDIVAETNTSPYLDSTFPLSLFSYLDRGALLEWLLHVQEAKQWCAETCHTFLDPIHLSNLPSTYPSQPRLYWPWQRKGKLVNKAGGSY